MAYYLNEDLQTDNSTRYDPARFMEWKDDCYDVNNSFFLKTLPELPLEGIFTISSEEHRPDILSDKIYEDMQYWYMFLWYNNLKSHHSLKAGDTIKYFSIHSLETLFVTLKTKEADNK